MIEPKVLSKSSFLSFQAILSTQSKLETIYSSVTNLSNLLRNVSIEDEKTIKNEIYDELKDTVKNILIYLQNSKPQISDLAESVEKQIKQLLLVISDLCSLIYCKYFPIGCGDMIKEFLSSQSKIFMKENQYAAPLQAIQHSSQKLKAQKQKQYNWTKESYFKTEFHRDCCEIIMKNLCKFDQKMEEMRLSVIIQYFKLFFYMDDFLVQEKILMICLSNIDKIEAIVANPSKQIMKQASKQSLEQISQYLTKILRFFKNDQLKYKIYMFGPNLGINMMNMASIEKKIIGAKIVNKYAYEMTYRNNSFVTQNQFGKWLVENKYFQLIFQENLQINMVKLSQDAFKLMIKRSLIEKEKFKKFFDIVDKSDPELRKVMLKLIDPYRVDYYQIEIMIEIFKNIKSSQFYDDDFFYFYEGLSRYATQTQLSEMIKIIQEIISRYYNKMDTYLTRKRSIECYGYIFDKLLIYKDSEERLSAYLNVVKVFLKNPSEIKLLMTKFIIQNISESKFDADCQAKLAKALIEQELFLDKSFSLLKNSPIYKQDLIILLKNLLKKYKSKENELKSQVFRQAVNFPEIFDVLLNFYKVSELQNLLNDLVNLCQIKEISFECLKKIFMKINWKGLRPIKKQYTDLIATHVTTQNPGQFQCLDVFKYLLFNSRFSSMRKGSAELIVEVYTNLADDFREEGEIYLIQFMKKTIKEIKQKLQDYFDKKVDLNCVMGTLQLIEELMLSTEYFGVGHLRAHNSLIPTSTTLLKVYNNCTYGDDVLKIYEKRIPSNQTLFEVILQISKQFKISPLDIALEYPNSSTIWYNGLTLEQLKLNNQELNAIKLPQSRLKKEPLLVDGELSKRAVDIFTEIFHRYAINGLMGKKQCSNYIEGVTLNYCSIYDARITSLFSEYDDDKDEQLTLQNFLRFYKDCVLDIEKLETVEKNIVNLRFRRDLKKYDEEIDNLNEQVLFRYHIHQNKIIYDYLFKLTKQTHADLKKISERILIRLPTHQKITEQLNCKISFAEKNSFEVQYMLTAIQSLLNKDYGKQQSYAKFLQYQNHLAIFEHLTSLSLLKLKTESQQNCFVICLHILRSLIKLENLKYITIYDQSLLPTLKIPPTDLFQKIVQQSIQKNDITIFQPALALQLTQNTLSVDWIEMAAFNGQKQMRVLTCSFLYLWSMKTNFNIDLFGIEIHQLNNQEWFQLLAQIIKFNKNINYQTVFLNKIEKLKNRRQSLSEIKFDPIINGSLKIIKQIINYLSKDQINLLNTQLSILLKSLISNENRLLVYQLRLKTDSNGLIEDISQILDVEISKQISIRNKYVGIKNLGCICYINSILQQFFMINKFKKLILTQKNPNQLETKTHKQITFIDDFLYQLQKMYFYLEWGQKQFYNPHQFCLTLKNNQGLPINLFVQEDAHQFLNTAFDKIEGYLKKEDGIKKLEDIFGGKTVTQIICLKCKNKIEVLEHFYHLSLEVKGMKTLKESFDKLIQSEEISDYYCVSCQEKVQKISKQTLIKQVPQILIINLQRIIFDLQTFLKVKVHTRLQFNHKMDISTYVRGDNNKPLNYSLKGIVIHAGTSESGHYYSLIKENNDWYKFNDQTVSLFNISDIGRQAFGGNEDNDYWGENTSSTNAYILFYQRDHIEDNKKNIIIELPEQLQMFKDQVLNQNQLFYRQVQAHQPSTYQILDELYNLKRKEGGQQMLKILQINLKIFQKIHLQCKIKDEAISQIKNSILQMFEMIPQRAIQFIHKLNVAQYRDILCTNSNSTVRFAYQSVLIKALGIFSKAEVDARDERIIEIAEIIISSLFEDVLQKNIHKSYQYFSLIKSMMENQLLTQYFTTCGLLGNLLDFLMGSESPFSQKDKKRNDIHSSQVTPLIQIVVKLVRKKKESLQLNDKQRNILNDQNFYRRIMKNKLDIDLLSNIIPKLAHNNEKYSKMIAQVLLRVLNSNDEVQNKTVVFININAFLRIDDNLSSQRLEWILGIPQLQNIRFGEFEFGMATSSESRVYSYASSLFYIKQERYMPLLNLLFQKRKYFNALSCYGIIYLLQLVIESDEVLNYILRLPAPVYIFKTYFDWIQNFIFKLKNQEHYGLPLDKTILLEKLNKLFQACKQRQSLTQISQNSPVNKFVIGKNFKIKLKEIFQVDKYKIQMWVHDTFVLENKPYGLGNFSLPESQFSYISTEEQKIAKYFIKCIDDVSKQNDEVKHMESIITFSITTQINLILKFNIPTFNHVIYVKSGQSTINCPFVSGGSIAKLIEISENDMNLSKQSQLDLKSIPEEDEKLYNDNDLIAPSPQDLSHEMQFYMEISCKECTFINIGREKCEICDSSLFN